MVFSRFRKSSPVNCSIHVGDICVPQIHSVKDLGAFLDTHMTLETHLDRTSAETLVHAFVSSR